MPVHIVDARQKRQTRLFNCYGYFSFNGFSAYHYKFFKILSLRKPNPYK